MLKQDYKKYQKYLRFQNKRKIHLLIISFIIIATYLIVYFTDDTVYVHAMYIAIIYTSFAFGINYSIAVALIAAMFFAPFLYFSPLAVMEQSVIEWLFRLIMFVSIAILSGIYVKVLKSNSRKIIDLYSLNQETNIPNRNSLEIMIYNHRIKYPKIIVSTIINNYESLLDVFGPKLYNKILTKVYDNINCIFESSITIQPESNKLWLIINSPMVDEVIDKVITSLDQNIVVDNIYIYVDFVFGVNFIENPDKDNHIQEYLDADTAAGFARKNSLTHAIYNKDQLVGHHEFKLLGSFQKAIENKELFLAYQPIINLETNKIERFEALIRWNHPTKGLIPPNEFIPIIEQTQLIHQLSPWLMKEVIEMINEFRKDNIEVNFSINISAKNLYNKYFVDAVINMAQMANIKPGQIEFEITETQVLHANEKSISLIQKLVDNGFFVAIDDFGKGYSSLTYLHQFPITTLKIDNYYTTQLDTDESTISIIEAATKFAHSLGMDVVCEGIETSKIDKLIRKIKPNFGQGYFYSKPIKDTNLKEYYFSNNGYLNNI